MALVTKSGTNSFHGSAYEYNRNSCFSANDYFLKYSQLNSDDPNKPQFLNRNIFGGSVGGPIKKDQAIFFLNYEAYRDVEQVSSERSRAHCLATRRRGAVRLRSSVTCNGNTVARRQRRKLYRSRREFCLSPTQLYNMDAAAFADPNSGVLPGYTGSIGPNPAMLAYFNQYPLPNDFSTGDGLNTAGYRLPREPRTPRTGTSPRWITTSRRTASNGYPSPGPWPIRTRRNAPFLPAGYNPGIVGGTPATSIVNFNKGLIAGYSAVISSNLVNNFRYGFIRESRRHHW